MNDDLFTNELQEKLDIQIVLGFEVPELKKNYVVYTTEGSKQSDKINLLISEYDSTNYQLKDIPNNEIDMVLSFYNRVKESLLSE